MTKERVSLLSISMRYVTELEFKLVTPEFAVRHAINCTMGPGSTQNMFSERKEKQNHYFLAKKALDSVAMM